MKRNRLKLLAKISFVLLASIITVACVEEFSLESRSFEKLLVVDGNISNQSKIHEVRLSYTVPIDSDEDPSTSAATGASVWVEDDLGNRTDFTEQSNGIYSSPNNFAGVTGRSYSLFIVTSEGKRYQSSFEEMVEAPAIDDIYHNFAFVKPDDSTIERPGLLFSINVTNASQSTEFFRYELSDTHQIIVPYPKTWEYVPSNSGSGEIIPFTEDVRECYREADYSDLVLTTSSINENGEIRDFPVKFVDASLLDVTTFYSLEVTQRAISAEAYSYYRKLELFNESNGSLFDKQQGTLIGNIKSIDTPDEQVLGYFEVSGAHSSRMFLGAYDFDRRVHAYLNSTCGKFGIREVDGGMADYYQALDVPEEQRAEERIKRAPYDLYFYNPNSEVKFLAHRLCTDCTRSGKVGKPDYWP